MAEDQISRPSTFSVSDFTSSGTFSRCGLTASALRKASSARVRSAPTFGSLAGASGSFFFWSLGGTTRGSFWAKATAGSAAMIATATIADRQFRNTGNLKAINRSLDAENHAAKQRDVKD